MRECNVFAWAGWDDTQPGWDAVRELLRRLRIGAGLSQEELAGRSGLAERTIARLEQGRSQRPHPGSARRLAQALGLPDAERADLMACAAAAAAPPGRMRAAAQDRTEHGPRHLLPDTALFTGRDREIGALSALAEQVGGGASPGAVVISAIDGMGGVGKTALALHAAHRLARRYPGRAPVHQPGGFTEGRQPLDPSQALAELLRDLGTPPQRSRRTRRRGRRSTGTGCTAPAL